jgi:hypothetical protein
MNETLTDIRPYFGKLEGEVGPRIAVSRAGKPCTYEELQDLTLEQLADYEVRVLGEEIRFKAQPRFFTHQEKEYDIAWSAGHLHAGTNFAASCRATDFLSSFYSLTTLALSASR